MFEEKKSLIVEHDFFWSKVPDWMYFGRGLQANHGTVRKVQYSCNQAIKKTA